MLFLCSLGVSLGLVSGCSVQQSPGDAKDHRPNIVVIIADDAGWNDVGYHGSEIQTPHLDRLAQEGARLEQFYVHPTCTPTRAALLSGRPPSRFGILSPSGQELPRETVTLAQYLRRQGYVTGLSGKWHLGLRPEVGPRQYGFDETYGYLHGELDQYTHLRSTGEPTWHRNDVFVDEEGHATDLIAADAIRFIQAHYTSPRPFFLYVAFSAPHHPLQETDEWAGRYAGIPNASRRLFAAAMTHLDDEVGKILTTLQNAGITQETLVVFMSDNGAQQRWTQTTAYDLRHGPNDRLGDNRPLRGWKGDVYDGGVHVPALVYWPGTVPPRTVSQVLSVCDLYPTLAHVAGSPLPPDWPVEGINVWDVILGGTLAPGRVLYWRTGGALAVRKGDWKLIHLGRSPEEGRHELYNMAADPHEQADQATHEPAVLADLRQELARQRARD